MAAVRLCAAGADLAGRDVALAEAVFFVVGATMV